MPASAVTRLNAVTYAGTKVGAGTNYHFHGSILLSQDYTTLTLRFLVICADDDDATFVTQCAALEAAFTTPNGDLKLEIGASEAFDLTQAGNTGMLAAPTIRKTGSSLDSNNTRLYSCAVTVQLPADEAGKSGRQSSKASYVSDGAEIVRLDVVAVYTALGANGALAQAKSAFPTYVGVLQATEGGTWDEDEGLVYQHDSDDKICQASSNSSQVIANQSRGSLNDDTLQGVQITVVTRTLAPGDAPKGGAKRLQRVTVAFACRVRKSESTDLWQTWVNTVRPHMLSVAEDLSGNARLTVTEVRPGLSPQTNSINARITLLGTQLSLIRSDVVSSTVEDLPVFFEPVLTGGLFDRDRHTRPGSKFATVNATILEAGGSTNRSLAGFRAAIRVFTRQGFEEIRRVTLVDRTLRLDGQGISAPLTLRARRMRVVLERATVVGGAKRPISSVAP